MTRIGMIGRTGMLSGAVLGLILAVGGDASAQREESGSEASNPDRALFPKDSHPYGKSIASWAENWWAWLMSVPFAVNPNLHLEADCGEGQSGPVFFLPANLVGQKNVVRSCTV